MSSESVVGIYMSIFGTIVSVFGISVATIIALTQVLQPVILMHRHGGCSKVAQLFSRACQ